MSAGHPVAIVRGVMVWVAVSLGGCSVLSPPVSEAEIGGFASNLSARLVEESEPIVGNLSEDDAVARAMRFNLEARAKDLEAEVAEAKVRVQAGGMLPDFVAESNYYRRDRPLMSRSTASPLYAGSSDLKTVSRDITLSWNILDFGLSLVHSRQALDKAYQSREEARRVRSRIAEETRSVFWRAVAAQTLQPAAARLDGEVDEAMTLSRMAAADPQVDPMASVSFQRETLNLQRELNDLHVSISGSVDQLKELIGQPMTRELRLNRVRNANTFVTPAENADDDIHLALRQRPEIRQYMYELRITDGEVDATILKLLPGVSINTAFSNDTNSFLLNGNWVSWGTRIAVNLINLARLPNDLGSIEAQAMAQRESALAMAATIAMQVHVARARIAIQKRAYRDAQRFAEVQKQLLAQVRGSIKAGKTAQQALVREKVATLLAEVRATIAFGNLQAAYAAYASARGDDADTPDAPAHSPIQSNLALIPD